MMYRVGPAAMVAMAAVFCCLPSQLTANATQPAAIAAATAINDQTKPSSAVTATAAVTVQTPAQPPAASPAPALQPVAPKSEKSEPAKSEHNKSEPAKPAPPPKPAITLAIDIDLTRQHMTIREYGKVVGSWPISSGRDGYRTPTGTFRPAWQAKMWYSRKYDMAPMPHSVFFNGGIAMHATQVTNMLGYAASHGCIRQAPANAARTYALVTKHGYASTRIVVRGTARDAPAYAHNQDGVSRTSANNRERPAYRTTYGPPTRSTAAATYQNHRQVVMVDSWGNYRSVYVPVTPPRVIHSYRPVYMLR